MFSLLPRHFLKAGCHWLRQCKTGSSEDGCFQQRLAPACPRYFIWKIETSVGCTVVAERRAGDASDTQKPFLLALQKSFTVHSRQSICALLLLAIVAAASIAAPPAKDDRAGPKQRIVLEPAASTIAEPRGTSTIHWQGVPLREAVERLQPLFDERIFVDRRVDPDMRVSLDATASSAEQLLTVLADEYDLGVAKLGKLVYLGPVGAARILPSIANMRSREIVRLPADARTSLMRRDVLSWPRLAEPRQLVTLVVEQCGWRVTDSERIPLDLWSAGELPEMSVAEKLSVLLMGFDLTFEFDSATHAVRIVPLPEQTAAENSRPTAKRTSPKSNSKTSSGPTKQVYTLRVQEKPVGAVLRELSTRLHWAVQVDEDAIRAAGKSLDKRVSFSVENADREKLLDALLSPAGLEYQIDGNQIRVVPQRY